MAALELRNKKYRIVFMYQHRKYAYSLDTGDRQTAEALRGVVEKTLMLIEQKAIRVPDGADIVAFVKNGGKVEEEAKPTPTPLTLAQFIAKYLETHGQGAMEANSLATVRMHLAHFESTLGERFAVRSLTIADLQQHVDSRRKKKYRGRQLSPVTLRKEVASFRAAWNWGAITGLMSGPFPSRGLVYPKTDEKPPFMTMLEIRGRITTDLQARERDALWDCVYLTREELPHLLAHVQEKAVHAWIHPFISFVAHTGGAAKRGVARARAGCGLHGDDGPFTGEKTQSATAHNPPRTADTLSRRRAEGVAGRPPRRTVPVLPGGRGVPEQETQFDDGSQEREGAAVVTEGADGDGDQTGEARDDGGADEGRDSRPLPPDAGWIGMGGASRATLPAT